MRAVALALAVVAAVAPACAGEGGGAPAAAGAGEATVTAVVDGDTIRARLGGGEERVRLIGIDTPETHGAGGLRECFGAEATDRLTELLPPGTVVRLERDVEARDRYGRLLAYVYRADDGLFVNLALAQGGYADVLTFPPNVVYADQFAEAVRTARERRLGLWQRCGGPDVALSPAAGQG